MELIDLAIRNVPYTDKYHLGYIENIYDSIFSPRKDLKQNILEIGILYGGSVLLWRDFFTNSTIYGADITHCPALENQERVVQLNADAYSLEFVNILKKESFDIIIDDGPHTLESMVFYILHYLPLVKSGGLFVLEDIINPHWTPFLLELIKEKYPSYKVTVYDMRNKQKGEYLLNLWKNGLDVIVVEK